MNEPFVLELWDLIKEYVDRKHVTVLSEKFVNLVTDFGITDHQLEEMLGHDDDLDIVIRELLDIEDAEDDDDYEDD